MLTLFPARRLGDDDDDDENEDDVCCRTCADKWWYAWLHLLRVALALVLTFGLVHFPSVAFLQKFMLAGTDDKVPWWRISPLLLPVDVLFFLAIGLNFWIYGRTRHVCPTLAFTLVSCSSLWLLGSVCMRPLVKYRGIAWTATEIWSFWACATALKLIGLSIALCPVSWLLLDRWATVRESESSLTPVAVVSAFDRTVYVRERALFRWS